MGVFFFPPLLTEIFYVSFYRCCQIMGRSEQDELTAAQIFYPCMQCADIFFLKVPFVFIITLRTHNYHSYIRTPPNPAFALDWCCYSTHIIIQVHALTFKPCPSTILHLQERKKEREDVLRVDRNYAKRLLLLLYSFVYNYLVYLITWCYFK